ncbi:DUF58 domain-containing protein [Nocardioides dubius]|uniref:DUF58 domain-containing protein n=1 Tax=Nocardioides dubius TaxID=317019 RepID=A0ABP4EB75_9ACTN
MLSWRHRITPAGRAVLGVSLVALVGARLTGLAELGFIAVAGLALFAFAVLVVSLPARVEARVLLRPAVTVVGRAAKVEVRLRHRSGAPLLLPVLDLGQRRRSAPVPWLARGGEIVRRVEVAAQRRGVHVLGPIRLLRADPLGLVRRPRTVHQPVELYVHPVTVPLRLLGLGSVRDLEGVPSSEISMSDLSFHALREYVPGDDLRHVHWRSSAKADTLLVRQYHDTRRSRSVIVLDSAAASFADADEFELAVSVAASLGVQAARADQDVLFLCGPERLVGVGEPAILDACTRIETGPQPLTALAVSDPELVAEVASLVVVTGSRAEPRELAGLAAGLEAGVEILALRCAPGAQAALEVSGALRVLTVPGLSGLEASLAETVAR